MCWIIWGSTHVCIVHTKVSHVIVNLHRPLILHTVYPKKYAHGFCFAVLCCGYTLTDFPISIMLTSLALWQSNDCPCASKATVMNMDKYFMWIHYERLHNHNNAKHNKTVCMLLGIYCTYQVSIANSFQDISSHATDLFLPHHPCLSIIKVSTLWRCIVFTCAIPNCRY